MKIRSHIQNMIRAMFLMLIAGSVAAEERLYGSFMYNSEIPNALFFMDAIKNGDDFELRKALRNHDIDTIVLASPGGSVWAGLSMAGIIFDKKLRVYVPPKGICASACSFMFFGGNERLNEGELGVHQFASSDSSKTANTVKTQAQSQFTVSEIIGFLNEFDTPRFVLERMFEDREMYWFNKNETGLLNSEEFTLDAKIQSAVSNYTSKKFNEAEAEEAAKPKYSKKELIALIQKRLNEIGCSAGVADGIWGRRTNSAAVRFAKMAGLPTATEKLISEEFFGTLAAIKKGTCPKPKVAKNYKFARSYFVSCDSGRTAILELVNHFNGSKSVHLRNSDGGLRGVYQGSTIKFVDYADQWVVDSKHGKLKYIGQARLYRRESGLVYKMIGTGTVSDCKKFTFSAR